MRDHEAQQCSWIVAPLVEAGLDLPRIRSLVFHLGFEAIVDGGPGVHERLTGLVGHEAAEVRAAWTAMIGRMLALEEPDQPFQDATGERSRRGVSGPRVTGAGPAPR